MENQQSISSDPRFLQFSYPIRSKGDIDVFTWKISNFLSIEKAMLKDSCGESNINFK